MAYVTIASSRYDAGSPGETGLLADIIGNIEFLKGIVDTVGVTSLQAIYDDFAAEAIDSDVWTSDTGGAGPGAIAISATDHYAQFTHPGGVGDYANLLAVTKKMRVRLSNQQSLVIAFRAKRTDDGYALAYGLQDIAHTTTFATSDTTDFIGIINDGSASTWQAKVNKAGAGTTTSGFGNIANWTAFLFTVIKGPSSLVVDAYADGSQISGFPVSSNVPDTVTLRPCLAHNRSGTASADNRVDYFTAFWTARPLAP